jgi:aldehyde:ferredoxin oxidoreductase
MPPTGHQVSPERLEEFRRIYKNVYGEELTQEEAVEMTHRLLALHRLLMRPLPD